MELRPAFSVTARPRSVAMVVSGEYTLEYSVQRVTLATPDPPLGDQAASWSAHFSPDDFNVDVGPSETNRV